MTHRFLVAQLRRAYTEGKVNIHQEPTMAKATQLLQRANGSQVKIVAEEFFGRGLHRSVGVYVLRRDTVHSPWTLCSDRPAPNWRTMPVADYIAHGRSEMLQTVTPGEILKVTQALNQASTVAA